MKRFLAPQHIASRELSHGRNPAEVIWKVVLGNDRKKWVLAKECSKKDSGGSTLALLTERHHPEN